jgi:stage V sporulation protein R
LRGADWDFEKLQRIHDERGYRRVRRELARQYDVGFIDPNIEVVDVDLAGDPRLMLRHAVVKGAQLNEADAQARAPAPRRSLEL